MPQQGTASATTRGATATTFSGVNPGRGSTAPTSSTPRSDGSAPNRGNERRTNAREQDADDPCCTCAACCQWERIMACLGCCGLVCMVVAVVLVALQFTIGWPLDLGNDGDSTEFTRVSNTALNGSIQLSLVTAGTYENEAHTGGQLDMATDFCAGLEQAGDLPADSCAVYKMEMYGGAQEEDGSSFAPQRRVHSSWHLGGQREMQEQEQGPAAALIIEFYFRLQIEPGYLPDRDEADLHSALDANLRDTVRIGRLVNAMRQAGNGTLRGVTSASGLALDLITREEARESEPPPLLSPTPTPSPSTSTSTSSSPSVTPSGTPSSSITPSTSATPSPTGTSSSSPSTSPSTSPTPSGTATASPTPSGTSSVTASPTQTPSTSSTPTPSTTPTATPTPSITPSVTPTPSPAVVAVPADFQGELDFNRPVLALAPQGMISFLVILDSESEGACPPTSKGETGEQPGRNYTSYHVEADLSSVLSAPAAALAPPSSKLHCGRSYGGTRWTPGATPCNIEFDCRPLHEFGLSGNAVHCEPLFPETFVEETVVERRLAQCNGSREAGDSSCSLCPPLASMAARTVASTIRLLIPAGGAKPAPPVGPALGQAGLNIMGFCKDFNARTQDIRPEVPVPVVITVYSDKTYEYVTKKPPVTYFVKQAAGLEMGSQRPGFETAGTISLKHVYEIAKVKAEDACNAHVSLESICKSVVATCKSMGVRVVARPEEA